MQVHPTYLARYQAGIIHLDLFNNIFNRKYSISHPFYTKN
jgi:hypothetical protein